MKNVKLLLMVAFVFLFVAASVIVQRTAEGQTKAKAAGAELCKECHEAQYDSYVKSRHSKKGFAGGPANKEACNACHLQGAAHLKAGGGAGAGGIVSLGSKKVSVETKNAACLSCHASSKNLALWDMGAHKKNDVACISCHNTHGKKVSQTENCTACHKDVKKDINRASHHPIIEGKVKCSDCHNPHGTLSHGMIKAENINQLCYTCHPDKRGPFMWEHAPVEENCGICHTPHGSKASKLLTNRTPSLCQDCHSNSGHMKSAANLSAYGGFKGASPSSRQVGRKCLNCHSAIHGSNAPENPSSAGSSGRYFIR
jgi:DmsE family decaheme c-type cytochrome